MCAAVNMPFTAPNNVKPQISHTINGDALMKQSQIKIKKSYS